MALKDYQSKRDFESTPEPSAESKPGHEGTYLVFVVHKHAARALHYDLRLELEGVLKSWAVPKGPPLAPLGKRLAVQVEDHPLDYKDFEGLIPEGNYGAGSVIIWDRGIYAHPADKSGKESEKLLLEGLQKGDMKFVLAGEKLKGEFALIRTKKDEKSWLLIKKKDPGAAAVPENILGKNRSVASGRTLEEIIEEEARPSLRQKKMEDRIRLREAMEAGGLKEAPAQPMPHNIKPMLATLIKNPFDDPDWIFEIKWDGYRAVAEIRAGGISLYSRNGVLLNPAYYPIVESLEKLGFTAILDGEIVVVDDRGYADFQMLQDYRKSQRGHLRYYVFDLLYFEGHDLMKLPLTNRKELLKRVLPADSRIKFNDHIEKEGILFFRTAAEKGLEGIVAKHARSIYLPGKRSRQWLKVKTQLTQEGIIAGFTEPRGRRKHFGALVLGVYEGRRLDYIGLVGGGFDSGMLEEIHQKLVPLISKKCPFTVEPETKMPVTWVKPELVCEVVFHGWTEAGVMRQPVFSRLREDKAAREVVREGGAF